MFERMSRGWELTKQSWAVLRTDKQLIVFPALSSLACFLVAVSFIAPAAVFIDFSHLGHQGSASGPGQGGNSMSGNPFYYVWLFGFYFVNYFVIAFFNSALVACAWNRFNGEDTSVRAGLRVAVKRLPQILGWTLVNATVGVLLRMISEKSGSIGKYVVGLIGLAWTIASYFVVPILVVEGVGPIEAVKRSTATIRKTWGESLTANVTIGAISVVVFLLSLIPAAAGVAVAVATDTLWPAFVGLGVMVVGLIAAGLVTSTLQMIVVAATYRYASTGLVPEHFDGELLEQAFRAK